MYAVVNIIKNIINILFVSRSTVTSPLQISLTKISLQFAAGPQSQVLIANVPPQKKKGLMYQIMKTVTSLPMEPPPHYPRRHIPCHSPPPLPSTPHHCPPHTTMTCRTTIGLGSPMTYQRHPCSPFLLLHAYSTPVTSLVQAR